MILSMTGFGKHETKVGNRTYRIEIRTLNSKGLEFRTKMPDDLRDKDLDIRKMVQETVIKGKIELTIGTESPLGDEEYILDETVLANYCRQLDQLSHSLNIQGDVLQAAMRIPSVFKANQSTMTEDDWKLVQEGIISALEAHKEYRREEGKAMYDALLEYTDNIVESTEKIKALDSDRIAKIRKKFETNFESIARDVNADPNRLELELIYYLEKLDFSEEMVRLLQHCEYLIEQIKDDNISKGRKLNFITQEMGREINTLGAKAYDSEIQRYVVQMKDDLEKIKEQTANIL
ncbi:MAG: YicC family protein [Saprospirales bacterium]|nr:MAG: YicC family protein [Saprospirales bacterium]